MHKPQGRLERCLKKIRQIGYWLDEQISTYALYLAVIVSVVTGFALRGKGFGIYEILTMIGCILAASFALIQWDSDRRVKRAELLNNLTKELTSLKINELAKKLEESDEDEESVIEGQIVDKLAFLSYVAYLGETRVLSNAEFDALRLDMVRNLESKTVIELVSDACAGNSKCDFLPYSYLLKYGVENCRKDVADKYMQLLQTAAEHKEDEYDKQNSDGSCVDSINSNKFYRTHAVVLNDVFGLNYRAHMRGSAKLPDGSLVWFPKYREEKGGGLMPRNDGRWANILDEKGNLLEYWPKGDEIKKERVEKLKGKTRYAFGMNIEEQEKGYKFLGVYKYKESQNDHAVYERKETKLIQSKVDELLERETLIHKKGD